MSIDIEELDDENENRRDFRRANGAPLVSDPADPSKTLRYSRPSGYAKCLDDEMALTDWRIWKAMEGVAKSKALQTQVVATRDEDKVEKRTLREKALDKGNASERADQGTGLHAMTVRAEDPTDTEFDPPEQYLTDLTAYRKALDDYGLISEMTECAFVNDAFRAAGTADRVWRTTHVLFTPGGGRIDPGTLIVGDLKTGKKLDFSLPGYAVQTALYATGQLYDVVTERRLPTPPISHDWALIAHMPVGGGICEMRWVSVPLGLEGARLAQQVKEWRKLWKNGTHDAPIAELPADVGEVLAAEFGAEAISDNVPLADMAAWCQLRINNIGANNDAKTKLIQRWPEGLPTPKKGITTDEQVLTLMSLLDRIEAEFSIPFDFADPRTAGWTGHRSTLDMRAPILESQGTKA
jgi:hypothetical protein